MIKIPVLVDPVTVTALVLNDVTNDVASPFVLITVGVFVNAAGKVYEAVPNAALQ